MLAGKWLAAMEPADALAETEQMTAVDMSAALSSMKGHQAAEIIQVSSLDLLTKGNKNSLTSFKELCMKYNTDGISAIHRHNSHG